MRYLRLYEDFVRKQEENEDPLLKKPVNVEVDEAEENDEPENEKKPSPDQIKKKPVSKKKVEPEEEDENYPCDQEEEDADEPEIIREFKAHLKKMEKRRWIPII